MKAKEKVQELLDRLPDDCSLEDVLYHLHIIQAVDRGLSDIEEGRMTSHRDVAVRGLQAVARIQRDAGARGLAGTSAEEIEDEVEAARRDRRRSR